MKKTFKFFSILLVCLLAISLTSCSLVDIYGTSDSTTPKTEQKQSEKEVNTNPVNPTTDTSVTLKESVVEHTPSSIEEAVAAVYDTVVVINAVLSNGTSSGSGVIIGEGDNYTYIITCFHVIEGAKSLSVTLSDQTVYTASVVGGDSQTDIAVISIEAKGLKAATFIDDSHKVTLASTTIAIGNPLGTLSGTVTVGVVSSTNRIIQTDDGINRDLIQTDAAVNSGNSGGGLFNAEGQLIGIVNAKFSATGVEGLAFAIPANTAKSIAQGLIEKGYVEGRYNLGVTFSDGYYRTGGFFGTSYKVVYASEIDKNGCCYGKLQVEDILVSIKVHFKNESKTDASLSSVSEAQDVINFFNGLELEIGDTISYTIRRGSYTATPTTIDVTVVQYIYNN